MDESNCPNKRQKMDEANCSSSSSCSSCPAELFNPNMQDFVHIVKRVGFINHTPLIQMFFGSGPKFEPHKLFVSAPTHFCKSSTMDMTGIFFAVQQKGTVEDERYVQFLLQFVSVDILETANTLDQYIVHTLEIELMSSANMAKYLGRTIKIF